MKTNRKLSDFGELTYAEKVILENCATGKEFSIRPRYGTITDKEREARAGFIRFLSVSGEGEKYRHEKGLYIKDAIITGTLDLENRKISGDLSLQNCRFKEAVLLRGAKTRFLHFGYSTFEKGFNATGLQVENGLILKAITVTGVVNLLCANIGSRLELDGSRLCNPDGYALIMDSTRVSGLFSIVGPVEINGKVELSGASVDLLCDSPKSWPKEGQLALDRFVYNGIVGKGTTVDAKMRLKWLSLLDTTEKAFSPQPYEQLAKVLREMGHREDAKVVLIEKERLQRVAARKAAPSKGRWLWDGVLDGVIWGTSAYGYRPFRAVGWLLGFIYIGTFIFGFADMKDGFKPNDSRVWQNEAWYGCAGALSQKGCYLVSDKGQGYPSFNPLIYSIDLLLPIVDLDQQDAWIPDEDKAPWARWYMWLHITLGWFFSLLAVAGFTGLIKPE